MDRLHKMHYVERKATEWIDMVRWETYEETNNLKTWPCMARYVEAYVWFSEKESKAKVGFCEAKMDHRETKTR